MQLNKSLRLAKLFVKTKKHIVYEDKFMQIYIPNNIISMLKVYRQLATHQDEKGGILIGYFQQNKIIITDMTHPYPLDKSSKYSFLRQDPTHNKILQAHWQLSGHKIGFAGDWHTHPEPTPTASNIDLVGWKDQIQESHPYVFIIQGTSKLSVYLAHGKKI